MIQLLKLECCGWNGRSDFHVGTKYAYKWDAKRKECLNISGIDNCTDVLLPTACCRYAVTNNGTTVVNILSGPVDPYCPE